jgi:hypothetical protein
MQEQEIVQEERTQVRDERGEHRTHVDNMLIRDYGWLIGANTIGVYVALLMHADKHQKCYPSIKSLADMTALSNPTVIQCLKLLKFLKIIDVVQLGKTCTNRYWMLDKKNWRKDFDVMLNDLTTGEVNVFNPSGKTVLLQRLNGFTSIVIRPNSNKTHSNNLASKARGKVKKEKRQPKPIIWSEYLKAMDDDSKDHIQLISYYFQRKNLKFDTDLEVEAAISRHSRYAVKICQAFPKAKVFTAFDKALSKYGREVTLETVYKELTK